jgi:hypothetical protein
MLRRAAVVSIAFFTVLALGCGKGSAKKGTTFDLKGEFAKVKAARQELVAARQALDQTKGQLTELQAKSRLTSEEQQKKTQLEADLKVAQTKFDDAFSNDQATLSGFLNTVLNDEQLRNTPEAREALQLYGEEAVRNADDFIQVSGDYRKAIDLLETAQGYFEYVKAPVPEDLKETLAKAKDMRYLTKDRFDKVKKGMTEDQVKEVTGIPFYANVRENEVKGRKIVSWLFNREDGGVAGIYFEKGKVYATNWNVEEKKQ